MPVSPRCPACRIVRREERNARVLETLRTGDLRRSAADHSRTNGRQQNASTPLSAPAAIVRSGLPFKPRLDRPVYCRFCHDARNGR